MREYKKQISLEHSFPLELHCALCFRVCTRDAHLGAHVLHSSAPSSASPGLPTLVKSLQLPTILNLFFSLAKENNSATEEAPKCSLQCHSPKPPCCAGAMLARCHFWMLTEVQPFDTVVTWLAQQENCQIFSVVGQLTRLMGLFQENEVNLTPITPKLWERPRMCHQLRGPACKKHASPNDQCCQSRVAGCAGACLLNKTLCNNPTDV